MICRRSTSIIGGSDGGLSQLRQAARRLERIADAHPLLAEALVATDRAIIEADEAEAKIAAAKAALAHSPIDLESAEARLFEIRGLARKHRVEADQLPALLDDMRRGARRSSRAASGSRNWSARWREAEDDYADWPPRRCRERARRRRRRLDVAVAGELAPLKLDSARFRTAIAAAEPGPSGTDRVEFEVSTNPGAPFGALTRIASGGELSRFILALKVALAEAGGARTMIFDEVDRGVGGAVASAIGERLARLASRCAGAGRHPQPPGRGARGASLPDREGPRPRRHPHHGAQARPPTSGARKWRGCCPARRSPTKPAPRRRNCWRRHERDKHREQRSWSGKTLATIDRVISDGSGRRSRRSLIVPDRDGRAADLEMRVRRATGRRRVTMRADRRSVRRALHARRDARGDVRARWAHCAPTGRRCATGCWRVLDCVRGQPDSRSGRIVGDRLLLRRASARSTWRGRGRISPAWPASTACSTRPAFRRSRSRPRCIAFHGWDDPMVPPDSGGRAGQGTDRGRLRLADPRLWPRRPRLHQSRRDRLAIAGVAYRRGGGAAQLGGARAVPRPKCSRDRLCRPAARDECRRAPANCRWPS